MPVTIVAGPPCSGKTSYVDRHRRPGDLVIDTDRLYQALGADGPHDQPEELRRFVFAARDLLYDQLARSGVTAWVVAGLPDPDDRRQLADRLAADVVVLATPRETCERRAADERPDGWAAHIDGWFARYQPHPDDRVIEISTPTSGGQRTDRSSTMTTPNDPPKDDPKDGGKFKPPASQEELDRIITQRIERERAKYADYDDLKAKAAKFDEAAEASKSEQQKLEDRVTKAEESAAKAQLEALRFRVATKHGISDEDAELFLTGTDEKALTAQAERLAERAGSKKSNHVPREGGNPIPPGDPKREFLASLRAG